MQDAVVTFDVFSALIDSRTGGTDYFQELAGARSWRVPPRVVYDRWDISNKHLHAQVNPWRSFTDVAGQALGAVYAELDVDGDPTADCAGLLASMKQWPLWPDVTISALGGIGPRLGLLSNIDDSLLAGTAPLLLDCFDAPLVVTSEQVRSYKPTAAFYRAAVLRIGPLIHVASSARDVRGAVSAGVPCIRLARPGHSPDPAGPPPLMTVDAIDEIPAALTALGLTG